MTGAPLGNIFKIQIWAVVFNVSLIRLAYSYRILNVFYQPFYDSPNRLDDCFGLKKVLLTASNLRIVFCELINLTRQTWSRGVLIVIW